MKKKIIEALEIKNKTLKEVHRLQGITKSELTLNDLDKNEIELKAQIKLLRYLLSK